jgi:hypothetical protein
MVIPISACLDGAVRGDRPRGQILDYAIRPAKIGVETNAVRL